MEQTILKQITETADGDINYTVLLLAGLIIYTVIKEFSKLMIKMMNKQTTGIPSWTEVNHKLDKKVNDTECHTFRERIGKESDEHRHDIGEIKDGISDIKEDVAFLRGRAG